MKIALSLLVLAGLSLLGYFFVYVPLQKTELTEEVPREQGQQAEMTASTTTSPTSTVSRVSIEDTALHPASGSVRIIEESGKRYLRYEELDTINGPDLFVYLATDATAQNFIDLGPLKATNGSFNYEIPADTDLSKYSHALIWCKAFSVLFNSADLTPLL